MIIKFIVSILVCNYLDLCISFVFCSYLEKGVFFFHFGNTGTYIRLSCMIEGTGNN